MTIKIKIEFVPARLLSAAANQAIVENPPNVIVEIWLGTGGRKLSAISFIPGWVGARFVD